MTGRRSRGAGVGERAGGDGGGGAGVWGLWGLGLRV